MKPTHQGPSQDDDLSITLNHPTHSLLPLVKILTQLIKLILSVTLSLLQLKLHKIKLLSILVPIFQIKH